MESGHSSELKQQFTFTFDSQDDISIPTQDLSSSSSPSSPADPLKLDKANSFVPVEPVSNQRLNSSPSSSSSQSENEHQNQDKPIKGHTDSSNFKDENMLDLDFGYTEDVLVSSMPKHESGSGSESATQNPQMQVMERPDIDPASSSPHRIPSSVFDRTKSTSPMEWSVTSNESLFSIHMENMSFTRDQLSWLGKSNELCKPGESPAIPHSVELSTNQLPPGENVKPADIGTKGEDLDEIRLMVTEATAAETMREVIRESSESRKKDNDYRSESSSHWARLSHRSDGSTMSFAFPILTGDGEQSISLKRMQQSQDLQPQPPSLPQTPKTPAATRARKATRHMQAPRRWFSCFTCRTFCS